MADTRRMTREEAIQKAEECRTLAEKSRDSESRLLLEEMARAWEKLATER